MNAENAQKLARKWGHTIGIILLTMGLIVFFMSVSVIVFIFNWEDVGWLRTYTGIMTAFGLVLLISGSTMMVVSEDIVIKNSDP